VTVDAANAIPQCGLGVKCATILAKIDDNPRTAMK